MKSTVIALILACSTPLFAADVIELKTIDTFVLPAGGRVIRSFRRPTVPAKTQPVKRRPQPPSLASQIPVGKFAVDLTDGTRFVGLPATARFLTLKMDFASLKIPFERIDGVTATKDRTQHTVSFKNGDKLTGTLLGRELPFKTQFGEVAFPLAALAKLTAGEQGAPQPAVASTPVGPTTTTPATRPVVRGRGRALPPGPAKVPEFRPITR